MDTLGKQNIQLGNRQKYPVRAHYGMTKHQTPKPYPNKLGEYLETFGLTQEAAGEVIGVQKAAVSKIVNGDRGLKSAYAKKLWKSFGMPADDWQYLYDVSPEPAYIEAHRFKPASKDRPLQVTPLSKIEVRGEVQAGSWREAIEWEIDDRYDLPMPVDQLYPGMERYALLVRGDSMNRIFPDGTVLVVINFSEMGRRPANGEYVVTVRKSKGDNLFEATVKAVQVRDDGSMILWPQSTAPEFQAPVIIPADHDGEYGNGFDGHSNGSPEVTVLALVVYHIAPTPKATFG